MSECFDGAVERLERVVRDELDVNVANLTLSFTHADVVKALNWAKVKRYTYERDGELGGLLLAAWRAGEVEPDSDFNEEMDVDVQG